MKVNRRVSGSEINRGYTTTGNIPIDDES